MSISIRQLELGLDKEATELMYKIDGFLREHWDEAYSLDELWLREFGEPVPQEGRIEDLPPDQQRFLDALGVLCAHAVVLQRAVRQEPAGVYYAAGEATVEDVLRPR